jgi:hypothetical protein
MGEARRGTDSRAPAIVVAISAGALILLGWWMGAGGWPGGPSACITAGDCSCEAFSDGLVVQPVNTLSSLVFGGAGLFLLLRAGDRLLGRIYATLVVFLGIGSAAFHASMTEWGGWLDLLGIHLFVGFVVVVESGRLLGRSVGWIVRAFVVAAAIAAPMLWWMDNGLGKYTAATLVAIVAGLEWRPARTDPARDRRFLAAAVSLFVAGLAVQWLGRSGGLLCDPDSPWQVHGLWHVLAASGAIVFGRYLTITR